MTWATGTSVGTHHHDALLLTSNTAYGQPDRMGGTWQLRRISSIVINGDDSKVYRLSQVDTHKGIILSATIKLCLEKGSNTLRIGGLFNGHDCKGADLDRIVVYPLE